MYSVAAKHRIYFFLTLVFFSANVWSDSATVAVASNFLSTLRVLQDRFNEQTDHSVMLSSGSTGKLYAQISNGAPFDIFLSADAKRPRLLEKTGYGISGSRFTYAYGKLVLWSATQDNLGKDCRQLLIEGQFGKLAIANPKTAPYGTATKETLEKLGLWTSFRKQLVRGENVAQTLQYVATRNVQLGFVALSQILKNTATACHWEIPSDHYTPLSQQAILLKPGENNTAALSFIKYLASADARQIIAAAGYGVD